MTAVEFALASLEVGFSLGGAWISYALFPLPLLLQISWLNDQNPFSQKLITTDYRKVLHPHSDPNLHLHQKVGQSGIPMRQDEPPEYIYTKEHGILYQNRDKVSLMDQREH